MDYVFRSENGCCPKCVAFGRLYYIQDRHIHADKYEYALMSRTMTTKKWSFPDIKEMLSFLINEEVADDMVQNYIINMMTIFKSSTGRMIECNGVKYVWNDQKKELREHIEPKQETGYFDTYRECLNMAKEILRKKEQENEGIQLSLF